MSCPRSECNTNKLPNDVRKNALKNALVKNLKRQIENEINMKLQPNKTRMKHIKNKDQTTTRPAESKNKDKHPKPAVIRTGFDCYSSPNLTMEESEGLQSLTKRIEAREIVIATSDKSNRFVVLKREQYLESGLKHTSGDKVITQDEVRRIQNVLNAHTSWFSRIFNTGSHWGHEARMERNITENGEQTCPMICLIKDHKGWSFTSDTPTPPSRPVIAGNAGVNRGLSEILSLLIEPITSEMDSDCIDSTSDMLSHIEIVNKSGIIKECLASGTPEPDSTHTPTPDTGDGHVTPELDTMTGTDTERYIKGRVETLRNAMVKDTPILDVKQRLLAVGLLDRIMGKDSIPLPGSPEQRNEPSTHSHAQIQEEGFVIIGSDVEKLYPSLKPLEAARLTRIAVLESNVEFQDVDFTKALRYLYVVGGVELLDRAGVVRHTPKWLGKRGDLLTVGGTKTNQDKYWKDSSKTIHRWEQKNIVASLLEVGVIIAMGTHMYSFNGVTYIQLLGGPIGLRLTAALANLVMSFFDMALKKLFAREKIKTPLSFRYVDDSRFGMKPIRPGWRWLNGKMVFIIDKVAEDSDTDPQKRTTRVIYSILNSVVEYLKFTTEDCQDYQDLKLPTLDCKLWVEGDRILHSFFEKPQTPNRVLLKTTALSKTSLESTMVQEGVRRLLNTSTNVHPNERNEILNTFVRKMINSGFSREEAQLFVVHAATSFTHKVMVSELPETHPDYKPLFRGRLYQREDRLITKALSKNTWFRGKNKKVSTPPTGTKTPVQAQCWKTLLPKEWKVKQLRQRHIEGLEVSTVLIVPNTENGCLLDELIKKEAQLSKLSGYHIKMVEGNGTQLYKLFPSPLLQHQCAMGDECYVCQHSDGPSKCSIRSVVYVAECLKCWDIIFSFKRDDNGRADTDDHTGTQPICTTRAPMKRQLYIGESSRSLRERSAEHFSGAKRLDAGNFISKHWQDYHEVDNDPPLFIFRVHSSHTDPLSREICEAVMIQQVSKNEDILNSKSEWGNIPLSRLTLEVPEWKKKKVLNELEAETVREKDRAAEFKKRKKTSSFDHALRKLELYHKYKVKRDLPVSSPSAATSPTHGGTNLNQNALSYRICQSENNSPNLSQVFMAGAPRDQTIELKLNHVQSHHDATHMTKGVEDIDPIRTCNNQVYNHLTCYRAKKRMADYNGLPSDPRQTTRTKKSKLLEPSCSSPVDKPGDMTRQVMASARTRAEAPSGLTTTKQESITCSLSTTENTSGLTASTSNLTSFSSFVREPKPATDGENGYLWILRNEIESHHPSSMAGKKQKSVLYGGNYKVEDDVGLDLDNLHCDEYTSQLEVRDHDYLAREVSRLCIGTKKTEKDFEKSINSPIDPTIWSFVLLLSEKLDDTMIPNLFGSQNSPTSNMLIHMLENHKLRSTYDFEKAVCREWGIDQHLPSYGGWNFRLIDAAAGTGTVVDTIFKLKEKGIFKGAKRKLTFGGANSELQLYHKCARLEELDIQMSSLELSASAGAKNVVREKVKIKLSDAKAGWHGNKKSPPKLTPVDAKKKRSGRNCTTPGRGQSLMLDFINCTPRGKLTAEGMREREAARESPK